MGNIFIKDSIKDSTVKNVTVLLPKESFILKVDNSQVNQYTFHIQNENISTEIIEDFINKMKEKQYFYRQYYLNDCCHKFEFSTLNSIKIIININFQPPHHILRDIINKNYGRCGLIKPH